jgi:hypothetical protein
VQNEPDTMLTNVMYLSIRGLISYQQEREFHTAVQLCGDVQTSWHLQATLVTFEQFSLHTFAFYALYQQRLKNGITLQVSLIYTKSVIEYFLTRNTGHLEIKQEGSDDCSFFKFVVHLSF